jgi:hypothetical protein
MAPLLDDLVEFVVRDARAQLPPAGLIARTCRSLRDWDEASAARQREFLHEQNASGNVLAGEVLDLLFNDPWWTGTD